MWCLPLFSLCFLSSPRNGYTVSFIFARTPNVEPLWLSVTLTLPPMQLQIPVCLFSLALMPLPSISASSGLYMLKLLALFRLPTVSLSLSAFLPCLMSSCSTFLPAMGSGLSRWCSHLHRRSISKARGKWGCQGGRAEHPIWWWGAETHSLTQSFNEMSWCPEKASESRQSNNVWTGAVFQCELLISLILYPANESSHLCYIWLILWLNLCSCVTFSILKSNTLRVWNLPDITCSCDECPPYVCS